MLVITPKTCLLLPLFLFHFAITFGQFGQRADEEAKRLSQNGIDTVVRVSVAQYMPVPINVGRAGLVYTYTQEYLFYRKGASLVSQKIVEYSNCNGDTTNSAISKPLPAGDDSLMLFLNKYYKNIESERIAPYVYKLYDSVLNMEGFYVLQGSHAPLYNVSVYIRGENIGNGVNLDDLLLKIHDDAPVNINYEYNNKTKLSLFVNRLSELIIALDKRYTF